MRTCGQLGLALAAAALLTGACAPGRPTVPDVQPVRPPAPLSWSLQHRVAESRTAHVFSKSINYYEESMGVRLASGATTEDCYASVSAPGHGGPDNKVGEKVPTTVGGRPGFHNGAGAEYPYLIWQLDGGGWAETTCSDTSDGTAERHLAALFQDGSAPVGIPFKLSSVPAGWLVSEIVEDLDHHTARVGFERATSYDTLEIRYDGASELPAGEVISINGRIAYLDDKPEFPRICILEQGRHVCVGVESNDTQPNPDRSADIPTIRLMAEGLSFARDLDDPSTWYDAGRVFD